MSAGRRTGLIVGVRRRDYGVFVVQLRRRRKAGVRRVDFGLLVEVGIFLPVRLVDGFRTVEWVVAGTGSFGRAGHARAVSKFYIDDSRASGSGAAFRTG